MPTLYYVPMIHTPQELGILKDAFLDARMKMYGEKTTLAFLEEVKRYWHIVERRIERAGLYHPEIASQSHIFIDSLPHTEETLVMKIVQELILQKIPAYLISKILLENGATIHGTEDPDPLLQEHRYWKEISQGKTPDPEKAQELLRRRDQYIAQRIISVVPDEDLAVLFMGRLHDVVGIIIQLSKKFTIVNL